VYETLGCNMPPLSPPLSPISPPPLPLDGACSLSPIRQADYRCSQVSLANCATRAKVRVSGLWSACLVSEGACDMSDKAAECPTRPSTPSPPPPTLPSPPPLSPLPPPAAAAITNSRSGVAVSSPVALIAALGAATGVAVLSAVAVPLFLLGRFKRRLREAEEARSRQRHGEQRSWEEAQRAEQQRVLRRAMRAVLTVQREQASSVAPHESGPRAMLDSVVQHALRWLGRQVADAEDADAAESVSDADLDGLDDDDDITEEQLVGAICSLAGRA